MNYTVAIVASGTPERIKNSVIAVWSGNRFRKYDASTIKQYKIKAADSEADAMSRALEVHSNFSK